MTKLRLIGLKKDDVKSNMGRLGDIVTATRDLTATPVGVPVPTIQLARRFISFTWCPISRF